MFIKHKEHGMTLIELLIAMVLGIVVVGGLISVFSTTVRFNSDNLQMIRLNQELRGVMSLISRDLRRAGYFNSGATTDTTYLDTFNGVDADSDKIYECIYFAYDIDGDGLDTDITSGTVYDDASDFIAYKLTSGEVKLGTGTNDAIDTPGSFNCTNSISWEAITEYDGTSNDRSDIEITTLQFKPECSIAGGAVDTENLTCSGGVEVRNIKVTITGQVITPVDNTPISRTLTETIKLRNDAGV